LLNRLIQTSQTGVQWYSATSPFSIPCSRYLELFAALRFVHAGRKRTCQCTFKSILFLPFGHPGEKSSSRKRKEKEEENEILKSFKTILDFLNLR
jgi:hypothetical protein